MWALKTHFMRRTGVRVSMFRNSIIHQIFFEFLQPLRDFRTQRVAPIYLWLLFMGFGILLAWFTTGCPDRSSTLVDTVTGEMSLSIGSSHSRVLVSLTVGDENELENNDSPVLNVSSKLTSMILKTNLLTSLERQ